MEEYLIFFAIGGLLFLTLLVNSVSDAYEERQRQKRIKILRIKQGLDDLSYLLENLKSLDIPTEISDLLSNEIMARLQVIQKIDGKFRGLQALLEEAAEEKNKANPPAPEGYRVKDEKDFRRKMVLFRRLIKWLNSNQWYSAISPGKIKKSLETAKVLRCEKIFQFYIDKAKHETDKNNFLVAKENYHYVVHALKSSGISGNPRVVELIEQTEYLSEQVNEMISNSMQKRIMEEVPEAFPGNDAETEKPGSAASDDVQKASKAAGSSTKTS
jgi:hypothetical protein